MGVSGGAECGTRFGAEIEAELPAGRRGNCLEVAPSIRLSAINERTVLINRAPVLTLWASVVAERLGFNHAEALSVGKAGAGLTAQPKGRHLGIFKPVPEELKKARAKNRGEEFSIEICGRQVPAINAGIGVRAVIKGEPIDPKSAARYLVSKFGESLGAVRAAMRDLAKSFEPDELMNGAFGFYEGFRPEIPEGATGWGAKGHLNLDRIRSLASER